MQKYPSFTILLVCDEEHDCSNIRTATDALGITDVIECSGRDSALFLIREHKPGIVLLAFGNPGKSGEEILGEIVRGFPEITVIAIGENQVAPAVRCMKKGASDYLGRPFSPETLGRCIRAAGETRGKSLRKNDSENHDRKIMDFITKEHKMISLGRIWTGIAHEIRNPLSSINIYLRMLMENFAGKGEYSEEEIAEVMAGLRSASDRIEGIVRRVLDFSKPHTPNMALSDVNQCIRESADLARVILRKEGIAMETSLGQGLPESLMEPRSVSQVVLNLLTNAADVMKDMEGPKKITISSSRDENHLIIKVSDSGPGVAPEYRDKIFGQFFTTKPGGLGIGLSICNRIIRDHGGYIKVGESIMGGAEFRIGLPISGNGN